MCFFHSRGVLTSQSLSRHFSRGLVFRGLAVGGRTTLLTIRVQIITVINGQVIHKRTGHKDLTQWQLLWYMYSEIFIRNVSKWYTDMRVTFHGFLTILLWYWQLALPITNSSGCGFWSSLSRSSYPKPCSWKVIPQQCCRWTCFPPDLRISRKLFATTGYDPTSCNSNHMSR